MPEKSGFDPLTLPESNATLLPEPFHGEIQKRWNRRVGDHLKLTNFGVNLTRIAPGGKSAPRHAHSRQMSCIVLEGSSSRPTLEWKRAARRPVCWLSGGDRERASVCQPIGRGRDSARRGSTAGDEVSYPDIGLHGPGAGGRYALAQRRDALLILNRRDPPDDRSGAARIDEKAPFI